jgi:hypothetical protein
LDPWRGQGAICILVSQRDLPYYVFDSKDVRARRIRREAGLPDGEPFQVFAPSALLLPAWVPATAMVSAIRNSAAIHQQKFRAS